MCVCVCVFCLGVVLLLLFFCMFVFCLFLLFVDLDSNNILTAKSPRAADHLTQLTSKWLQIRLFISPSTSIQTPGQPVL